MCGELAVIVAMVAVVMMQVPAGPVVGVGAVRNGGVSAARAMLVAFGMNAAFVPGFAFLRVGVADSDDVVVDVIAVLMVQMPVVQVVLVTVVHNFVVATAMGVVVLVFRVLFAGIHRTHFAIGCRS